ncbi:hypothetical protein FM103_02600 [Corynebacterium xerosis]|nr:hypothetical protein FM103_02600 [Corynebacterium xerosis]
MRRRLGADAYTLADVHTHTHTHTRGRTDGRTRTRARAELLPPHRRPVHTAQGPDNGSAADGLTGTESRAPAGWRPPCP